MTRFSLVFAMLFAACGAPSATDSAQPFDAAAPPVADSPTLVRGVANTFTVSGFAPNQRDVFLLASAPGAGTPYCPGFLHHTCTGLNEPAFRLASTRADANGVATFVFTPPARLPLGELLLDVAVRAHGRGYALPVQTVSLVDAAGDADLDGLSNSAEARARLDPGAADTDDDGLDDGAELEHATDPRDHDSDDDGLDDGVEIEDGLDPNDDDSDDDGIRDLDDDHGNDGVEVGDDNGVDTDTTDDNGTDTDTTDDNGVDTDTTDDNGVDTDTTDDNGVDTTPDDGGGNGGGGGGGNGGGGNGGGDDVGIDL